MNRVAWAMAATLLAAATPSPSPSLDGLLAAPPAGYAELTTAQLHGHFTAADWASNADASKQSSIVATMKRDGFVDGYGKTWASQSAQHVLLEAVFAFAGGQGAHNWLSAAEISDKKEPTYVRADTASGLGTYYGGHIADTAGKTFGDVFSILKGNDIFVVGVVSTKDDALVEATTQATNQYKAAPDQTIPSRQWPENNLSGSVGLRLGGAVLGVLMFVFVAGVIVLAVGLVLRGRRRGAAPAMAYAPAPVVQLSPDGNYWWDGQAWRDAASEVPPHAQRSSDGAHWWDGHAWHPVPQAAPPQPQ